MCCHNLHLRSRLPPDFPPLLSNPTQRWKPNTPSTSWRRQKSLQARIRGVVTRALEVKALRPLICDRTQQKVDGVTLVIKIWQAQDSFEKAKTPATIDLVKQTPSATHSVKEGIPFDPFLPYDESLFICSVNAEGRDSVAQGRGGATHVCLLNKFPVCDDALVLVTKEFRTQMSPLAERDFQALTTLMRAQAAEGCPGLAFYNSGKDAGASQAHKHIQFIPLSKVKDGDREFDVPIEALFDSGPSDHTSGTQIWEHRQLPFLHKFHYLTEDEFNQPDKLFAIYDSMMTALQLCADTTHTQVASPNPSEVSGPSGSPSLSNGGSAATHTKPYNLLLTSKWLMVVPRRRESVEGVSMNGMDFAGLILLKRRELLPWLESFGYLRYLAEAAVSSDASLNSSQPKLSP